MKKSLIRELDKLENSHWWHRTKQDIFAYYIDEYLRENKNKRVIILEVGAGAGNILATFKDKADVIALDPDRSAIEYCKKRGIVKAVQKTLEEYNNFKPGSIDIIIAADVIEHIKDDGKAVNKMWNMLKKNGILLIHVPADQSLFSYWDKALHHFRRYSKTQLSDVLAKQHFYVENIFPRVMLPYPAVKIFRKFKAYQQKADDNIESDFKNFPFFNGLLYQWIRL